MDNAASHTAKTTPPPDLNPIENLWSITKRHVWWQTVLIERGSVEIRWGLKLQQPQSPRAPLKNALIH